MDSFVLASNPALGEEGTDCRPANAMLVRVGRAKSSKGHIEAVLEVLHFVICFICRVDYIVEVWIVDVKLEGVYANNGTIFVVHPLDFERELTATFLDHIKVDFIPLREGRQLRTRESSQRA